LAGHSKWHNIRLRKGKQDAERGKLFTKMAREIIVAAKQGGGNPDTNMRLKMAVQKAREASMPQDNIKRAIQRGTGEVEGAQYDEITYEGYGAGGVAVMIACLTDNRNRTVADIRAILSRTGGSLGESGSVSWMFDAKGSIMVPKSSTDEESLMMSALDAGAEDVKSDDDENFEVLTAPGDLQAVKQALVDLGIKVLEDELAMVPRSTITLGVKEAGQVLRMVDNLEDHDDVQQVWANFDIPEDVMEEVAG